MKPVLKGRDTEKQAHIISTKVKIQKVIKFLEVDGQKDRKKNVFQFFNVKHT